VNADLQERALRLSMYVRCSECARQIDLTEGERQQRDVEEHDLVQHGADDHACWLGMLGMKEARQPMGLLPI